MRPDNSLFFFDVSSDRLRFLAAPVLGHVGRLTRSSGVIFGGQPSHIRTFVRGKFLQDQVGCGIRLHHEVGSMQDVKDFPPE